MKIKRDFVTNSSSTSFIISIKDEWNERAFLEKIGATGESSLNNIFMALFEAIDSNKVNINEAMKEYGKEHKCIGEFLKAEGYESAEVEKVEQLLGENREVYYGRLRSDGNSAIEVYFCMESFIICDQDIYFNGRIEGW